MKTTMSVPLSFIRDGKAEVMEYDGITDDLLSGGLGLNGLRAKTPPSFENPENPTVFEIRRRAIWYNYRALMDLESACYGKTYGPGAGYDAPELIPGLEIMALSSEGVTMMLQIPRHFDPTRPFLVAVPSSGSRGVYGGIGVVGEWALKRGFAVVYTDKGTGVGYHILDNDTVILMDGRAMPSEQAGNRTPFDAVAGYTGDREEILTAHNRVLPHRIAVKHAHAGENIQKNWGRYVLEAIVFARTVLSTRFSGIEKKLKVIAGGISNGGLASIMAREQDRDGLIHALAVSEPNVTPVRSQGFSIVQGDQPPFSDHSKSMVDYMTLFNVLLPCAALSPELENAPLRFDAFGMTRAMCEERCLSMKEKGLLQGDTVEEIAAHALARLRAYGVNKEQEILLPAHYALDVTRSIALTYISQLTESGVLEHLGGYSFAAVNSEGRPRTLTVEETATLFSDQSGIPPFGIIKLINDLDPEGPHEDRRSTSPSTGRRDMNLDGALMLRRLVTGHDGKQNPLSVDERTLNLRLVKAMETVKVKGNLKGCPAVIVTGRSDAVLPVNHTSRPYVGLNAMVEKKKSGLRYYEVTEAHHVDALNMLFRNPETCDKPMDFAPLHVVYTRALDLVVDHLEKGASLPPSQVVRPAPPFTDLPDILQEPSRKDRIVFKDKTLFIPE